MRATRARHARACLAAALLLTTPACFAVTDFDQYRSKEATVESAYLDLRITLKSMKAHQQHYFEWRVVNGDDVVQTVGVLEPLAAPADRPLVLVVPAAVPRSGPARLDFFADVNGTRSYDGIGPGGRDHAWRIADLHALPRDGDAIEVSFTHDLNFVDIETQAPKRPGVDGKLRFSNMGEFTGKILEVRFIDRETRHVAGLHRLQSIAEPAFELTLPRIIENGVDYDVDVFVDANGNGSYDAPAPEGGDAAWRIRQTANPTGLIIDFDPSVFSDRHVDVQFFL
jgi:hypothetical protein